MDRLSNNSGLHFDELQRPLPLHLILSTRSGSFIREIPIDDVRFHETLMNGSEISFSVYKKKCLDKNKAVDVRFWQKIKDLKLAYCKELDRFYELRVNLDESDETVKSVTAISLGEAEASQCNLYGIEINTDADIARDDYKPSVLYDEENKDSSIVDRLISKMPHYRIGEVDSSIRNIQRTFRFDGKSVYDACQEVGKEIGCLFQFECRLGDNHKIVRTVHVRDMLCTCDEPGCGARGDFTEICEKCGSTNISRGYGEDTPIYISRDNLAENIEYEADVDSVKNCFRLAGGDDLMTAAIIAQNPNGTQYLWYITDEMREDMSDELREKLGAYDVRYSYYQTEYAVPSFVSNGIDLRQKYNEIVRNYSAYNSDLKLILGADGTENGHVVGYPAIMEAYYNTIDLELYLRSGLMPNVVIATTNAAAEAAKLTSAKLSPAAVSDLEACTATTAANAVLGMARCLVRASFSVKVKSSSYNTSTHQWTGVLTVKNYSDEDDTEDSQTITVTINDDLEKYIRQKIETAISKDKDDPTDIVDLFALVDTAFSRELKKYSLKKLEEFRSACQVCMDVMIQHGVNRDSLSEQLSGAYDSIYIPYRDKMAAIESEIRTRSEEIEMVSAKRDENGNVIEDGLQSMLERIIGEIHSAVDFETFVGSELMEEFASYRRDDSYENPNYISDGLDNKALFQRAAEFLTAAKYEIARAARVHHSIKATLSNLLQMKEFLPIIDDFRVGNRLRVKVDDKLYVLRLTEFEVDYETFGLSVVFSDAMEIGNPVSDIAQILGNARSISTSYNAVMHQASEGKKSSDVLSNIAENGLKLTTHIVGGAHNQEFLLDESGYLGRTYVPETDSYSPEQIRIISNGIYITDDDWETMKAALGKFQYFNPESQKVETGFGVIADQLVGGMLLTNSAGIYNENGSVVINDTGMTIVVDKSGEDSGNTNALTIKRKNSDGSEEKLFYVDSNGDLVIKSRLEAAIAKIGGFDIGDSALYNGGKSTIDASTNGVYLGTDGISLGNSVFEVTNQGFLTSKSGTIGGFTIGSTSLKNTNSNNTVGLNAPESPGKDEIAIWAGSSAANIDSPFYVKYDGSMKSTKGNIGGFTITANELYSGNKTGIDVNAVGVYLGANGISLGQGKFKVTNAGALTAKSGQIAGFTIADTAIYSGSKSSLDSTAAGVYVGTNGISLGNAFKVTDAGKVTASDINITGGSISIKKGNVVVFNVDESGNASFSGQVDVGQLVGYARSSELESFNEVLQHAVDYGTLEAALSQTYADVNAAIQNAVGYAIDYNKINAAIKSAVESYNNATTSGSGKYPEYFSAGHLYIHGYDDSRITNEGVYIVKFNNALYDIQKHTHDFELETDANGNETGKVYIKEADWTGADHFFNIADTKFFKDAVSAAGGGINADDVKANYISYVPVESADYGNGIIAKASEPIQSGNKKYVQAKFNLTAGHQISGSEETSYDFLSSNRIFNIDVTNLVSGISSLKIYTPDDNDNPYTPRSGYNEQYFTIEANGSADNYIRVFYEYDASKYNVYYAVNSQSPSDAVDLFELDRVSGGSSGIDINDVRLYLSQASNVSDDYDTDISMTAGSLTYDSDNDRLIGYANAFLDTGTNTEQDSRRVKITMSASKKPSSGINADDVKANYISCVPHNDWDSSGIADRNGGIKTNGSRKYVEARFDLEAGHQADNEKTYVYSPTDATYLKIDVTSLVNSDGLIDEGYDVTHSITQASDGDDWNSTVKQYNFTVNNSDAGCVRLYKEGNVIKGVYTNGPNELYSNPVDLFTVSSGSSGDAVSYSVTPAPDGVDWDDDTRKFNFIVNGSNVGNVKFYIQNGYVYYSYYSDNLGMSGPWFQLSEGGSEDRYVQSSQIVANSDYNQIKLSYNRGSDQIITLPYVWNSYWNESSSIYDLGYAAGYNEAGGSGSSEGVTIIDAQGHSRTYYGGAVYISDIVRSQTSYGTTYAYQWGADGEEPYVVSRYA